MALNEDLNKAKEKLEDLKKEYRELTGKPSALFDESNITNVNDAIRVMNNAIDDAKRKTYELNSGFGGVYEQLEAIVEEQKKSENAAKKSTKALKGVSNIARELRDEQAGYNKLSEKELKKLKEKNKKLQEEAKFQADRFVRQEGINLTDEKGNKLSGKALDIELKRLKAANKINEEQEALLRARQDDYSAFNSLNNLLKDRIKKEEQINELMGLGGAAVEAVGGALNKLGMSGLKNALGLDEVSDKMREIAKEKLKEIQEGVDEGGEATLKFKDKMAVLSGGIEEAGKQLIKNLKDPLAIVSFLTTQLVDALMAVDKQSGALAKNFGISYDQALALNSELNTTANLSGELNVTTANLVGSFTELNNRYGTFATLNSKTLTDFTKLTKQAYLSNDAALALQDTTFLTGKGLEESTEEFLGQSAALAAQNGLALNQKQILESVKNISTATLLQLQGQPEALAEAVVNAKALGLSLDKVEQIASSLLNFESSISAEMEAELLTGKQLNLERARLAALNGDIATVAEEIAKQVGTAAEFTEMNVIQQDALAKSVGMTRDDLAKSLMEREAMAKLSDQEGKTAQERFNNLVKEVGLEEAKKRLGDEQLANLYGQQNTQEKFAAATEKLKEMFVSLATPILQIVSPLVDLVTTILPAINFLLSPLIEGFKLIGIGVQMFVDGLKEGNPLALTLAGIMGVLFLKTIATAISGIFATFAQIPLGIGIPLAITATAGLISLVSKAKKGDDVMSPGDGSGYGKRTLMGPEGAIALNNKDTVIAGTNLFDRGKEKMEAPQNNNISIDISPLVERMSAVENVLIQILNKEGDVYMDGAKVGKSLTLATSRIG